MTDPLSGFGYVPVFLFLWAIIVFLYEHWPRTPKQMHNKLFWELYNDQRRRGLSPQEMSLENEFRKRIYDFRVEISEKVSKDLLNYQEIITEVENEHQKRISDRYVRRRFIEYFKTPWYEKLTPEVADAVGKALDREFEQDYSDANDLDEDDYEWMRLRD